jgi:post-segregation antitoxin (ccd killing protein)
VLWHADAGFLLPDQPARQTINVSSAIELGLARCLSDCRAEAEDGRWQQENWTQWQATSQEVVYENATS